MPLRDHFHSPWKDEYEWEGFHSGWINAIVRILNTTLLPPGYRAAPQVHLGQFVEADIAAFERNPPAATGPSTNGNAGMLWSPPIALQTLEVELPAQDVFEVRIHDDQRARRVVAVVELLSPGNKDRESNRQAFVTKCAAYLQQQVCLVVVDVVTSRRVNLDTDLLSQIAPNHVDVEDFDLFAVAYRNRKEQGKWRLDRWPFVLTIGTPLPTLPLWLAENLSVPLDLELTYQECCRALRID